MIDVSAIGVPMLRNYFMPFANEEDHRDADELANGADKCYAAGAGARVELSGSQSVQIAKLSRKTKEEQADGGNV